MFLMFRLGRLDFCPTSTWEIQKGIQRAYRLRKLPPPERVKKIGPSGRLIGPVASGISGADRHL